MINWRTPTSAHWYDTDGKPCYEVPCKSKPGEMRATTLRDARKLNLVPSVTSILSIIRKPALEDWRMRSLLEEAVTVKRNDTESDKDYIDRIINGYRQNTEMARDWGTACHIAVEDFLKRDTRTATAEVNAYLTSIAVETFIDFENDMNIKIIYCEKPFACNWGYGGKVDIVGVINGVRYVIDMKFKETSKERKLPCKTKDLYDDDYGLQLAAYACGLGFFDKSLDDMALLNLFISVNEPGLYSLVSWDMSRNDKLLNSFMKRLYVWKDINNYNPEWTEPKN
jgi:hypothetical protein